MNKDEMIAYVDPDLEEGVAFFLKDIGDDLKAIQALLTAGGMEEIRFLAHRMKGSGASFGFDPITEFGARMESAATEKDIEEVNHNITKLLNYLDHVKIVYR